MPDTLEGFPADQYLSLQSNDPDLFALLSGTAPAELELAALSGSLPDATLTPAQRQEQNNAARVQQLVEAQVFGTPGHYEGEQFIPGQPGNVTLQFELESLAPQLAAQLKAAATPTANPQGLSQEGANYVNTRLFAQHIGAA
jgi:hypothetical protein